MLEWTVLNWCTDRLTQIDMEHTHTTILRPFVRVYPGEPVPEEISIHSHPSCSSTILIILLHLPLTIASSLLNPRTRQSLCTTSNHVLFGLPLGLEPTTSYSIHFTQSLSSFHNTCPYHRSLFCCSWDVMSTIPSLSLNSFETIRLTWKLLQIISVSAFVRQILLFSPIVTQ